MLAPLLMIALFLAVLDHGFVALTRVGASITGRRARARMGAVLGLAVLLSSAGVEAAIELGIQECCPEGCADDEAAGECPSTCRTCLSIHQPIRPPEALDARSSEVPLESGVIAGHRSTGPPAAPLHEIFRPPIA